EEFWRGIQSRPRVRYLSLVADQHDLLAVELVLVEPVAPLIRQNLIIDPAKNSRPVVVIILRPAIVGMIWAAGALQPHAQKQPGRGLAARRRIAIGSIEIGRRIVVRAVA